MNGAIPVDWAESPAVRVFDGEDGDSTY